MKRAAEVDEAFPVKSTAVELAKSAKLETQETIDTRGVAVITGGASGFGLALAQLLAKQRMCIALLDISDAALAEAKSKIQTVGGMPSTVLTVRCDVSDYKQCTAAEQQVANTFLDRPVTLLFNNAGIAGTADGILEGSAENWHKVFAVNLLGAMHIVKAFVPKMIRAGPLPSGKKSVVITTSSVTGLVNHTLGAYSVSKMAVTAMCEQLSQELAGMSVAQHILCASLHPTVACTNLFKDMDLEVKEQKAARSAEDVIDEMLVQLDAGKHYIIIDGPADVPTSQQIEMRMADQMSGQKPRMPEPLGALLALENPGAFKARVESLSSQVNVKRSDSLATPSEQLAYAGV